TETLRALDELCRRELAPSFVEGDRVPLSLDKEGNVTLPPGFRRSLENYLEAGFQRLEVPEHIGGFAAPPTVCAAALEMVTAANASIAFYLFGGFVARTLDRLGTPEQKERFCKAMMERK